MGILLLMGTFAMASFSNAQWVTPSPKYHQEADGVFEAKTPPALIVTASVSKADSAAVSEIQGLLSERFGKPVSATVLKGALPRGPFILLVLRKDNAARDSVFSKFRGKLPEEGQGDQGYLIEVTPKRITVEAEGLPGLYYGSMKLRELASSNG